jgi:hypothetical protein
MCNICMKYLLMKCVFMEMHWEKKIQSVLDFQTFGFCTTRTFVQHKFSLLICLLYG